VNHFSHQERLMSHAGYSGRMGLAPATCNSQETPRPAHSFKRRDSAPAECERLVGFLNSWLPDHITVHDRMMSASLRNRTGDDSSRKLRPWRIAGVHHVNVQANGAALLSVMQRCILNSSNVQ
jgi:hemerythrin